VSASDGELLRKKLFLYILQIIKKRLYINIRLVTATTTSHSMATPRYYDTTPLLDLGPQNVRCQDSPRSPFSPERTPWSVHLVAALPSDPEIDELARPTRRRGVTNGSPTRGAKRVNVM